MTNNAQLVTPDYYKVLFVSPSGGGKTYAFKNMDPETFGFINMENKPLPFKNQFKNHERPMTYVEGANALVRFAKDPKIEAIGFDSLSAWLDMLLAHARANYKGFDVWNFYNAEIGAFLNNVKRVPKEVFLTAHYEIIGMEGSQEKRVKVKGKEWEGVVEKEFSLVLFGDKTFVDGKPKYFLRLAQENSSAKCPPDIFGQDIYQIPNDASMIDKKLKEFARSN